MRVLILCLVLPLVRGTPLDDYVNEPDPSYNWTVVNVSRGDNYTLYSINMTSQTWGKGYVKNQLLWWHYVDILIPDVIKHPDVAFLFVDEGSNKDPPGTQGPFVFTVSLMGLSLGIVGINIRMVPNEPLYFANDPSHRSWHETSLLAWTVMTYLEQGQDPLNLIMLPMTKACIRAMDTGAAVAKEKAGLNISKFIISGASKRGWAVWLAAAVDKRIIALSPIVFDLLNMFESLHHMYRAYGGWTFALEPFFKLNFTAELDTPQAAVLQTIIDPVKYANRLTMPKLIIDTTGDEYFMLDNPHYYLNQLKGPTYIDTISNADHICVGHILEILFAQRAFFQYILNGVPLPKLTWKVDKQDNRTKLTVFTDRAPKAVRAFRAITIDQRRDFRLLVADPSDPMHKKSLHPVVWFQQAVNQESPTEFWVENFKDSFWTGFFIQVTYHGVEENAVLEFTTPTQIVPDTFPFENCHGAECRGKIV